MRRRSWAFDIAVAVVVGVLGQLEAWTGLMSTHRQGPLWAQSLLYAVAALLLIARRVWPMAVLVAMVGAYLAEFAVFGSPEGNSVALPPLVAVYTVGRYVAPPRSVAGLGLGVVLWGGWALLDPTNKGAKTSDYALTLVWAMPWVVGWLAGALVRVTRLYAEQRRATREQRASRAVAEERNRIARELHDVIGHSVSVMTVQATAVRRTLEPDQDKEREALLVVEQTGREALAEMRRVVGVLRRPEEGPALAPQPSLEHLDQLVAKAREAGLAVDLRIEGEPVQLAAGLDLTAYRLVQEGLTNTLKHARAQQAEVLVRYSDGRVELTVTDDGPGGGDGDTGGHGLVGMRERVSVYGGDLEAGPCPEGGYRLRATLPIE
jgi:signal transduction histidine kinase